MGEKLSFYKLVSEKNYAVEIPIIQRDYAQGRASASEIRLQFLTTLKENLDANKPIDLDFIYGSLIKEENRTRFIPLDGQQRLTTLFLLHWYLSMKENSVREFRELMEGDKNSKFSYETRITSRDFCKALISKGIEFNETASKNISEIIKDSGWFFLSWLNDPTIESMLNVLDDIHNIFKDTNNLFQKVTDTTNPLIGFQFIELENFGLSDNLYIKMNSRGKELTEFENFKAKFEQYIEKIGNSKLKDEFVKKIDTDWTDLFWNYRDTKTNVFDNELMNFIRVIATNNYSLIHDNEKKELETNVRELINNSKKFSYKRYETLNCFNNECLTDIIQTLDFLKNGTEKIKTFLDNDLLIDEHSLFEKVIQNILSYTDRVQFYALYQFLITNRGATEHLYEWIRVIRNLSLNTIYNDASEFAKSIKGIKELLPHSSSILKYLAHESNKVEGFAEIQITEERIKAQLILKSNKWKETITKYESHGYFLGQIDFILQFSGIKDEFKSGNILNWDLDNDLSYYITFSEYATKACIMFGTDGLNYLSEENDFLWQRALLTKGDYTLDSSRNKSFLINYDRDISWKRYLRDDNEKREYLKELFDEISTENTQKDLERMIKDSDPTDWKKFFIKRPEVLAGLGSKKFIRWISENHILLLKLSQTNGSHTEYYSYALKIKLEEMGNSVEYIDSNSIDLPKYISLINNEKFQIAYEDIGARGRYRFKLPDDGYKYFETEEGIIDYLTEQNYIDI